MINIKKIIPFAAVPLMFSCVPSPNAKVLSKNVRYFEKRLSVLSQDTVQFTNKKYFNIKNYVDELCPKDGVIVAGKDFAVMLYK